MGTASDKISPGHSGGAKLFLNRVYIFFGSIGIGTSLVLLLHSSGLRTMPSVCVGAAAAGAMLTIGYELFPKADVKESVDAPR